MRFSDVVGIRRLCQASIDFGDPHEPLDVVAVNIVRPHLTTRAAGGALVS
jgi:hypothetical protein